jgi:phospholipase C
MRACRTAGPATCNVPTTSTTTTTWTEPASSTTSTSHPPPAVRADGVFVIVMENHDWAEIAGNPAAPYINDVLLPMASHAEQYFNPPGVHPSEPNYLWLEAGTGFGISDDAAPATNHLGTTRHLVTLLDAAGVSWRAYEEGIAGDGCPVADAGEYHVAHDPFVFFDDVSGSTPYCVAHVRPYAELRGDLVADRAARYDFITPDVCHDMHDACGATDAVAAGDAWLSGAVPAILQSPAYLRGGVLFIVWDEGVGDDGPIGLIVVSPYAKGAGYANTIRYTHSSTLRTIEAIFGLTPPLGDTATAADLADLFAVAPWN